MNMMKKNILYIKTFNRYSVYQYLQQKKRMFKNFHKNSNVS